MDNAGKKAFLLNVFLHHEALCFIDYFIFNLKKRDDQVKMPLQSQQLLWASVGLSILKFLMCTRDKK